MSDTNEQNRPEDKEQEQQILIEDATLTSFGFTNPAEVKIER